MTAEQAFALAADHHAAGRLREAETLYRQVLAQHPAHADAHNNLAMILLFSGRAAEARDALVRSAQLKPGAQVLHNLGNVLAELNELDEAEAAYGRAVSLDAKLAAPHDGLGHVLWRLGRAEEATDSFRRAIALAPQVPQFHSSLLYAMQFSPREDAESIREEHRRFDERHARPLQRFVRPHGNDRDPDRRLRVGYVSPQFCDHVLALYEIPLFASHDRRQVEVFCYSNVQRPDHATARIRALADEWREIRGLGDDAAAEMIRADRIDVLVDLNMHMAHGRPLLFARKPAPVQAAWLAYPGTTGLSAIDYRLTDPYLDPPGSEGGKYSEESIRLPDTFWCYDPLSDEPVSDLPALANDGRVTFGCMNNFAKTSDGVFGLWAKVLARVEGSRMLLLAPQGRSRQRVLRKFGELGIDDAAARVAFADSQRRGGYLRNYHRIDIALDTLPYNGHTTSLDAMWMGVPVVALLGRTVVGRAGWSQLNNLKLTELLARDEEAFVRIAGELASDLGRLRELRATLRPRMAASPLMDARRFARDMESAYRQMWRRWCDGAAGGEQHPARGNQP